MTSDRHEFPHGVTVTVDRSDEDGAIVVFVDTGDETPASPAGEPFVRIHLNDCCVSNGTPLQGGRTNW